jgi:signal transduction histidine kinase
MASQREQMFWQVSALLAGRQDGVGESLHTIAELGVLSIGDGAFLRVLSEDGSTVESLGLAHRAARGRALLADWARTSGPEAWRVWAVPGAAAGSSGVFRGVIAEGDSDFPPSSWGCWYIRTPVLHGGQVVGTIMLFRSGDRMPYDDADLRLLRVLADQIGTVVAAQRAGARNKSLLTQLEAINADQRELVFNLDRIEARERGRLAEVLHDEPLQLAVAAMLRLDTFRAQLPDTDPGASVIEAVVAMVESCVAALRTVIGGLTPPDLSDGLGPALRRLADGIFLGTEVKVQVRGSDHVHLEADTAETVYRILREALVNARKHAGPDTVVLDLDEDDVSVVARLSDDGIGVDADSAASEAKVAFGHLGMASMRARAAAANARLTIRRRSPGGTLVELEVPRQDEDASDAFGVSDACDADASPTPGADGSGALPAQPGA